MQCLKLAEKQHVLLTISDLPALEVARGNSATIAGSHTGRVGPTFCRLAVMPKLDFEIVHSYVSQTGASNCLFQREHGELIGLEIESGQPKTFGLQRVAWRRLGI